MTKRKKNIFFQQTTRQDGANESEKKYLKMCQILLVINDVRNIKKLRDKIKKVTSLST